MRSTVPRTIRLHAALGDALASGTRSAATKSDRASPGDGAPVSSRRRIVAIDVLRGVAVLGILIVNVQGFAQVASAYMNPTSGVRSGADLWLWSGIHVFADTKFLSIFSMLFGVGVAMMSDRSAAKGVSGTALHCRRQFWLLIVGLVHAYLIWHGDVLVAYALCGFALYPLRGLSARTLLWIGGLAVAFVAPLWLGFAFSLPYLPESERAALAAEWAPSAEALAAEIEAFRGGWFDQLPVRAGYALEMQTTGFLALVLWRAGGLMLVGMGLYKLGVATGERSRRFYRRMAAIGLTLGLPLSAAGVLYAHLVDFRFERAMFQGALFNYVGSLGAFLGYTALVMLFVRSGVLPRLRARLAAVGRMALTNYVGQSVLATLVFYGHGLALFERAGPLGRMTFVAGIWALQLAWSSWWLARYRFGPLEWLWRSLSYRRRQPMRLGS